MRISRSFEKRLMFFVFLVYDNRKNTINRNFHDKHDKIEKELKLALHYKIRSIR